MCAYIYCSDKSVRPDKAAILFLAHSLQSAVASSVCIGVCVCVCVLKAAGYGCLA